MKDLKNLKGAKTISKSEQQAIKGGVLYPCKKHSDCDQYGGGLCMFDGGPIGYCLLDA